MKTKTELCKCGHEHNNHLPDGRCGCGGVTSTGQDWHCSCSYYTPKGKESAAKDGLLRKEPNKVATPPLSAPLMPSFEEWLKTFTNTAWRVNDPSVWDILQKHRELCIDHATCPRCSKAICSHTKGDREEHWKALGRAESIDEEKLAEYLEENARYWADEEETLKSEKSLKKMWLSKAKEAIEYAKRK